MPYVKITGYLEVDADDLGSDGALTGEAYRRIVEDGGTVLDDLEDITDGPDDRTAGFTYRPGARKS